MMLNLIVGCLKELWAGKRGFLFYLYHLSLLVIIAGGLTSAMGRVHAQVSLAETEEWVPQDSRLPFGFKVLKLEAQYPFPENSILFIELNDGTDFEFPLTVGKTVEHPSLEGSLKVLRYASNFKLDYETSEVSSGAGWPINPAVLVEYTRGDRQWKQWVLDESKKAHLANPFPFRIGVRFGRFRVSNYRAQVSIESKQGSEAVWLGVNQPFRLGGASLFMIEPILAHRPGMHFFISRDPGMPVVFIGMLLFCLSLAANGIRYRLLRKEAKHG